jgi:uncharacterized protein (DUF1800 family)
MASSDSPALPAVLAAHRFGLGEPHAGLVGANAVAWLTAQIGPADAQRGEQLPTQAQAVRSYANFVQSQRRGRAASAAQAMTAGEARGHPGAAATDTTIRNMVQADVRAHLATPAASTRPFAERLALFWTNHFTVSMAKPALRGLAGAFEREAIRPHIAGKFETLLKAAVTHGAMLRYLDNDQSAGPNSRVVQQRARRALANADNRPRITGLNENLGREVLELHSLGAASKAYTQADVTAFAAVLTGWRLPAAGANMASMSDQDASAHFDPAWHEPGPKTVLGKTYSAGQDALGAVLHDLAQHPATARFIALKLARHFVADEPAPELVEHLAAAYRQSDGDLSAVYRALVESPLAWQPAAAKLKTPAEFVISTARVLGLGEAVFARNADGGIATLGQRVLAAPSPAGWSDRGQDWLGPDAMWKRIEWATRIAERVGPQVDARAVARASLGPLLSETTATQLDRAADGPQALALLLMSPEFQRR